MSSGAMVHRRAGAKRSLVRRGAASLFFALLGVPVMAGCEDCGGEPPTNTGEPSVLIQSTSRRLQADGVTFVEVTVRAYDASFNPDNTAITAQVDKGAISSEEHTVSDDGSTITGTPANGALTFRYTCPRLEAGTVTVSATNGNATATSTLECTEPVGTVTLDVLTDAELPCTDAIADGQSYCVVPLEVMLTSPTLAEPVPQPDLALTAVVESATLTDPDEGEDPTVTDLALLALDGDSGALPQSQVTVTTDEAGGAAFRVHTRLDQPMSIVIKVSGTAANGQALEQRINVAVDEFESRATLSVVAQPQAIGSDLTTQLLITAKDHQANTPGADARVRVVVPPLSGAVLSGAAEGDTFADGVLDASIEGGTIAVTFDAPAVDVQTTIPVTVSYQPHPSLPTLSAAAEVQVYPDDSLILNVAAAPEFIRSDDNTTATVTATVTEFSQGSVAPKQGASVRFRVSSLARDRVGFGTRTADGEGTSLQQEQMGPLTDVNGVATAIVSSRNDRVRGTADIIVEVLDDSGAVAGSASVTLTLEREPILQSIVFLGAEPNVLGVRGGAYPSTAVMQFQVFDDLAQPLPNVPMTFDLNATADPGAVVVPHAMTDANGVATTTLSAGTQAGPLSVVATAVFNGGQMTTESLPVAVTAGLPSFANSYIQCAPGLQAQVSPVSASCTVVLADRFTNRAPAGLAVQFRAEGGNIQPAVFTDADGKATATYNDGPPGPASTSLLSSSGDSWSYGAVVPLSTGDTLEDDATRWGVAEEAACFDGDSTTPCSVFDLCFEAEHSGGLLADNEVFCPLLVDPLDDTGCWNKLEAAALTRDADHVSDALLAELGLTRGDAQTILDNLMTPQVYFLGTGATPAEVAAVRRFIDAHTENMFRCGAPTACITGNYAGVPFIEGDECAVAPGCMDFSPFTRCPHDGLRTITAIVRGEESFTDLNGNGTLDFEESPATENGRHDPGEPLRELGEGIDVPFHDVVVDMPEPFLDKDDNCFADDFTGSLRLTTYNAIRRNDLYNDEDDSGTYGYVFEDPDNPGQDLEPQLTNGQWDRDKEIFFSDHVLVIEGTPRLEVGAPCTGAEIGQQVTCPYNNASYLCEEVGDGTGVLVGCYPRVTDPVPVAENAGISLRYRWVDANGNCYSPGFAYYSHVYDDTDFGTVDDIDFESEATTVPLSRDYCGFGDYSIERREWCDALPDLGRSQHFTFDYTPTCFSFEAAQPSRSLRFVLTDSATINIDEDESNTAFGISFRVACGT